MLEMKLALQKARDEVKNLQGALHGPNIQKSLITLIEVLEVTNERLDEIDAKMAGAKVGTETVVWGS